RALRNTIQRYEPRLRNVRVSSLPPDESSPLNLRFEVRARLAQGDERIFFETLIDPEGKVQVR
ncbi:MAG: type VI secretion system baseplate subunit TssE, partial [Deltaproteobacteria bacterium]